MKFSQPYDFSYFLGDEKSPFATSVPCNGYTDSSQNNYFSLLPSNVANYNFPQITSIVSDNLDTTANKKCNINPALLNSKTEISQHDIMRQFITIIPIKNRKNKLYAYNGKYYRLTEKTEIKQNLLKFFRNYFVKKPISFISGVVDYMLIEPDIVLSDNEIRLDLLSFNNGVLNLRTGELYYHNPSFITTYSIDADYLFDTNINTPVFDNFINHVTNYDPILAERILQILGYCMTPDTSAKVILLFQGVGDSGKSVLTKLLQKLFSKDSIFPFKYSKLKEQFALSDWFGKTLCTCNDMPNRPIDEDAVSTLKELSGNDTISSPEKYKESIVFDNKSKILLVTNHAVISKTNDQPFYNRLVTVPFEFPATEKNPNLINELLLERNGIVTKAIRAYWRLVNNNYIFPGDYQHNNVIDLNDTENDSLAISTYAFVKSYFEIDYDSYVFTDDAYEVYSKNNVNFSKYQFSQYFKKYAHEIFGATEARKRKESSTNPVHCVKGIRFKLFDV